MVSTIEVAVNDDSEACDNIFLTGHLFSRNLVNKNFSVKTADCCLHDTRK